MVCLVQVSISAIVAIYHYFRSFFGRSTGPTEDVERGHIHLTNNRTSAHSVLDISHQQSPHESVVISPLTDAPSKLISHRRRRSTRWFPKSLLPKKRPETNVVDLVRRAIEETPEHVAEIRAIFERQSTWGTIKSLDLIVHNHDDTPLSPTSIETLPPYEPALPTSQSWPKSTKSNSSITFSFGELEPVDFEFLPVTTSSPSNSLVLYHSASNPALALDDSFSTAGSMSFDSESDQHSLVSPEDLYLPYMASVDEIGTVKRFSGVVTSTSKVREAVQEVDADWSDVLSLNAYCED